MIPSSCEKYVKYFSNKLTLQFWTFALNTGSISVEPAGITLIVVVPKSSEYPAPGSIILTSVTDPFSKTGTKTAPTPSPSTSKSGVDKYLLPDFWIITSTILPPTTIGTNWQSDPDWSSTVGCLSKFKISDDP